MLLSLTDPGWPDGVCTATEDVSWTYRSYADLATVLRPAAGDISHQDRFAGEMLVRWMDLIDILCRLAKALGQPAEHDPLVPREPVREALAEVRLDAAGPRRCAAST